MSSPSSSAFLNSTVVAPPPLVSSSPVYSTPTPLLVNSTSPSAPVPVPSVSHLPSPAAISPLSISALTSELKGHPSAFFRQYLLSGFRHGFRIGFSPSRITRLQSASQNMQSALQNPQVVDEYLSREVHLGRVAGPFPRPPLPDLHISRFGVIPKRGRPGKWRLIVDLSHPAGYSVNDGINGDDFTLSYARVEDAIDFIMQEGRGTLLAKIDIRDAYRLVPVHPEDRPLLGMAWKSHFFVDLALPFGLRSAPFIFNQFAEGWHWILQHNHGVRFLLHYLDDFLTGGAPYSDECLRNLRIIQSVAHRLGIPLAEEKVEGPSTTFSFLGVVLDTLLLQARLPEDKVAALQNLLCSWSTKRVCLRRDLESLLGHLHHAAKVVYPGRPFLRRLTDLLRGTRSQSRFIRLNRDTRNDLLWWSAFLRDWNGVSFFTSPHWSSLSDLQVSSDASGAIGFGAYLDGLWFHGRWNPSQLSASIAFKELYPIVIAAHVWGPNWRGLRVRFLCDNQGVADAITKRFCSDGALGGLLRSLFLAAARHSFWVSASHVPGRLNGIADALSRFQLQRFRTLAPSASPEPTPVPAQLLEHLVSLTSNSE